MKKLFIVILVLGLFSSCASSKRCYEYKEPLPIEIQMEEAQKEKDKKAVKKEKITDTTVTTVGALLIGVMAILIFN